MVDYTQIIEFFISVSFITGAIIFLAKKITEKYLESRIEKYKNSLQLDTEAFKNELNFKTEAFKHELQISSTEHQIRYSKLYEERGEIIKLIYNLLLELENSLSDLTSMFQGPEWKDDTEKDDKATESIKKTRNALEVNRIFFSIDLCSKIEFLLSDSQKVIHEMFIAKRLEQRNERFNKNRMSLTEEELLKPSKKWIELNEKVQSETKNARMDLAQEFRNLIGVS
ncbi:hypothetical protein [Hymenobacter sp. HDW8]|uniref:hypothetical protein n=1 Tax=Hymenobacter sp. HDW8 TaxID=2714932 RepID=UPI00140C13F2|nr:hypothetical protein [Hymenobacter sp. HDW8]QIL75196.1 hypothetical protein G7064_04535 [Hymenobacter sp. HDW8]